MGEKILVGMSGGVDSAVAALLLMKQGYQVSGCTLRLRGGRLVSIGNGNGETEIEDARTVCRTLGIEHLVLDLSDRFCRQVVDVFAEEYRRGRTPNPCVVCNRTIKFGGMLDYARQQGYDAIATGHYVRRAYWEEGKRWQLFRADSRKDQSYVLYGLSQDQLAQVRFPLYGLEKEEVRRLARENGLPVAEKGDSMEICFVPEGEHAAFIERYSGQPDREGDVYKRQVVSRAKEILHGLESEEGGPPRRRPETDAGFESDDGQLSLLPAEKNEVIQRLKEMDVNTLTPIEALQTLYELVKMASAY